MNINDDDEMQKKNKIDENTFYPLLKLLPLALLDGPAVVSVNIFVRSISKIDDVVMVSDVHRSSWPSHKTKKRPKIMFDYLPNEMTERMNDCQLPSTSFLYTWFIRRNCWSHFVLL